MVSLTRTVAESRARIVRSHDLCVTLAPVLAHGRGLAGRSRELCLVFISGRSDLDAPGALRRYGTCATCGKDRLLCGLAR